MSINEEKKSGRKRHFRETVEVQIAESGPPKVLRQHESKIHEGRSIYHQEEGDEVLDNFRSPASET